MLENTVRPSSEGLVPPVELSSIPQGKLFTSVFGLACRSLLDLRSIGVVDGIGRASKNGQRKPNRDLKSGIEAIDYNQRIPLRMNL